MENINASPIKTRKMINTYQPYEKSKSFNFILREADNSKFNATLQFDNAIQTLQFEHCNSNTAIWTLQIQHCIVSSCCFWYAFLLTKETASTHTRLSSSFCGLLLTRECQVGSVGFLSTNRLRFLCSWNSHFCGILSAIFFISSVKKCKQRDMKYWIYTVLRRDLSWLYRTFDAVPRMHCCSYFYLNLLNFVRKMQVHKI